MGTRLKPLRVKAQQLGRISLCLLLLAWVFHSIFSDEARHVLTQEGTGWSELAWQDRFQSAWHIGPARLWNTLTMVSPVCFGASLGCMGATLVIGIARWRLFLGIQGLQLSLRRTTWISLVAHFFNSLLLGSTGGDVLKAFYAARETHHRKAEAVTTVIADRIAGLFAMLLFACLMIPSNRALLAAHSKLSWMAGLTVVMMFSCLLLAVLAFRGGLTHRLPKARLWMGGLPMGNVFLQGLDACRQCGRHPWALTKSLLLSMFLNLFCVLQVWFLARGMGLALDLQLLALVVPMVICVSALPITPSGLGVRENLYVVLLSSAPLGVPATQALALSLLAYAGSLAWSIVGGTVYAVAPHRIPSMQTEIPEAPDSAV